MMHLLVFVGLFSYLMFVFGSAALVFRLLERGKYVLAATTAAILIASFLTLIRFVVMEF